MSIKLKESALRQVNQELSKENQFLRERCEMLERTLEAKVTTESKEFVDVKEFDELKQKYNGIHKVLEAQISLEQKLRARLQELEGQVNDKSLENKAMEDSIRIIKTVVNSHCFEGEDRREEEWAEKTL